MTRPIGRGAWILAVVPANQDVELKVSPPDDGFWQTMRDLQKLFHLEMIDQGYYLARRGFIALSLPTTEADAEGFTAAVGEFLDARGALIERAASGWLLARE